MALIFGKICMPPCGEGPDGSSAFSEPSVLNPNNTQAGGRLVRRRQNATTRAIYARKPLRTDY